METAAEFDLNKAIQAWRQKLSTCPAVRPADTDELEVHLRDSITALESKGLAPQEAFWVAAGRLGTAETLAAEFGKINLEQVWLERLLWMLTGAIVLQLGFSLSSSLAVLGATGAYKLGGLPSISGPLCLVLRVVLPVLFVFWFWQSGRHREGLVWRTGRRLKVTPGRTALIAFLAAFCFSAISVGANALSVRSIPLQTYSSLVMWQWPSALILLLIMPLTLAWLLARTAGRDSHPAAKG